MMKETVKVMFLPMLLMILIQCGGAKNVHNILTSNDIEEIQNYINQAHPDDPKNALLKKRIITLKSDAWMKARFNPMKARPVKAEKNVISDVDTERFEKLLQADRIKHKDKTVNLLNEIFNNNQESRNALLLVKNQSQCNTILHIKEQYGEYDLAVPHDGENFIVLEKGKYTISGNICGVKYEKLKDINKGIYLTLGN
ncbi:hypothetical protein OWR28_14680 [Chryseobacterium sp. 1B4]